MLKPRKMAATIRRGPAERFMFGLLVPVEVAAS